MWIAFTSWAGGAWQWFLKSPVAQLGAAAIAILFSWEVIKHRLKKEGAREQERINEVATARETVEMHEAQKEVTHELQERVTRADEAVARQPHFRSSSELRARNPELAILILGPDQGNGV